MTKIKHIWSVLCKESVINQDDNNVSIFGVLEELSVFLTPMKETGKLPEKFSVPMSYEIVSMWQKDKEADSVKAEIEYIFIDSENNELMRNKQMIEMPKTSRRHRSRMKITGMPLTNAGDYVFKIKIKEEGADAFRLVAELPLEVKINLQKPSVKPQTKN